ncbi:hypothetical protein M1403_00325 [Patescibacteria group bacterium]|nr:hypothetical protein [Patescibacteria group bacterium]
MKSALKFLLLLVLALGFLTKGAQAVRAFYPVVRYAGISDTTPIADGSTVYSLTVQVSDGDWYLSSGGNGNNIKDANVIINYQGPNANPPSYSNMRGQFGWSLTGYFPYWGNGYNATKDLITCTDSTYGTSAVGYAAIYDGSDLGGEGYQYVDLVGCDTWVNGNGYAMRSVSFYFHLNTNFSSPLTNNTVSGWGMNNLNQTDGWKITNTNSYFNLRQPITLGGHEYLSGGPGTPHGSVYLYDYGSPNYQWNYIATAPVDGAGNWSSTFTAAAGTFITWAGYSPPQYYQQDSTVTASCGTPYPYYWEWWASPPQSCTSIGFYAHYTCNGIPVYCGTITGCPQCGSQATGNQTCYDQGCGAPITQHPNCGLTDTTYCYKTFGTCNVTGIMSCTSIYGGTWNTNTCNAVDPRISYCSGKQCGYNGCGGECPPGCPSPSTCTNNICFCPGTGQVICSGTCTDLNNDPQNCGACNHNCGSGVACYSGKCVPPPNSAGIVETKDLTINYGSGGNGWISQNGILPGMNILSNSSALNKNEANYPTLMATVLKNAGIPSLKALTDLFDVWGYEYPIGNADPIISGNNRYRFWGTSNDNLNSVLSQAMADKTDTVQVIVPWKISNSQTIDTAKTIPANMRIIVFINGSLTVNKNITTGTGNSSIIFVQNNPDAFNPGNLTLSPSVSQLDGVYLFPGSFDDGAGLGALVGNGSLLAFGNSDLGLNRAVSDNSLPAERWIYQPKYLTIYQNILSRPSYSWTELTPSD